VNTVGVYLLLGTKKRKIKREGRKRLGPTGPKTLSLSVSYITLLAWTSFCLATPLRLVVHCHSRSLEY
jgi:hypothetical protein